MKTTKHGIKSPQAWLAGLAFISLGLVNTGSFAEPDLAKFSALSSTSASCIDLYILDKEQCRQEFGQNSERTRCLVDALEMFNKCNPMSTEQFCTKKLNLDNKLCKQSFGVNPKRTTCFKDSTRMYDKCNSKDNK